MKTPPTYAIGWAYPSSTHAVQFDFRWQGCYVVQRIDHDKTGCPKPPVGLSGHATKDEAEKALRVISPESITEGRTIWNSDGTDGPCLICAP